jgi:5-methylcytosine-specific restriction endonuclease McrBC regulatory subunit McrC
MDVFFEAWVESIAERAARSSGATMTSGRLGQTKVPLSWTPPSSGSQRSLIPDVVISREDVTVVVDAKYKQHAEEIERIGWVNVGQELRERHREDILQALAYSTLFATKRTVACLAYPVAVERWLQLEQRNRTLMRARVNVQGNRAVEVAIVAVPLNGDTTTAAMAIERCLRSMA